MVGRGKIERGSKTVWLDMNGLCDGNESKGCPGINTQEAITRSS
jgi:hypothetical protein